MGAATMDAHDGEWGEHCVRFDDPEVPLSTLVIETVAAATDADATADELDMYDAVDLDAVDALYRHTRRTTGEWSLAFTVGSHEVRVDSAGEIRVR